MKPQKPAAPAPTRALLDRTATQPGVAGVEMNMGTKKQGHTPGPWTLAHFANPTIRCDCGYVFGNVDRLGAVCTIRYRDENNPSSDDTPKREAMANARLIAAAPELLEALREVLLAATAPSGATMGEAILCDHYQQRIRAAIAKAEGAQ